MSSGITHFSISHFFLRRMILGTKIWSLDVHSYWSVIVFMAAQHTELENRHVHAHVFVFISITVSDLCVLWYYRLRKGISSILHKSIGILTWKIWRFCIGLPYSVLLEGSTSCGTRKKGEFEYKDQDLKHVHTSAATWWSSAASSAAVFSPSWFSEDYT